jgi:hypothetical protein
MRARGFLEYAPADEDQWVTIRGSFSAQGDSTVAETAAVSAVTQ